MAEEEFLLPVRRAPERHTVLGEPRMIAIDWHREFCWLLHRIADCKCREPEVTHHQNAAFLLRLATDAGEELREANESGQRCERVTGWSNYPDLIEAD